MRIPFSVLLVASLALGGCGAVRESAVNPFNWFGRSTAGPVDDSAATNPLIPQRGGLFQRNAAQEAVYLGTPFGEIVDMTIEQVPEGAIIRVTGRAARQGAHAVRLTPLNEDLIPDDGMLSFRLEGIVPGNTPAGAAQTREVIVAQKLTHQQLRGVTAIRVEGLTNARTARR